MTEANFYLCDVCGERVPKEHRFFISTDRIYNGIENVTEGDYVDLCAAHLVATIKAVCGIGPGRIGSYETGKQVLEHIKNLKKK